MFSLAWPALKNIHPFPSISKCLCLSHGAFRFPPMPVPTVSATAQSEIGISDRSYVSNCVLPGGCTVLFFRLKSNTFTTGLREHFGALLLSRFFTSVVDTDVLLSKSFTMI